MRSETLAIRSSGPTATAMALMAIVAMAAAATTAPAANAAQIQCAAAMMEQSPVRTVAAAVAAAARDLLRADGSTAALRPASTLADESAPAQPRVLYPRAVRTVHRVALGAHLLNLPPPAR